MATPFRLAKTVEFLTLDLVPVAVNLHKKALPANNNILAYNCAEALDRILDWPEQKLARPQYTLYHLVLMHMCRHVLHKYKRGGEAKRFQYKCWGISNFDANEGQWFTYMEYPLTEDLFALKREVTVRTKIERMDDEALGDALDRVTDGAKKLGTEFNMKTFKEDMGITLPFLELMLSFMRKERKVQDAKCRLEHIGF